MTIDFLAELNTPPGLSLDEYIVMSKSKSAAALAKWNQEHIPIFETTDGKKTVVFFFRSKRSTTSAVNTVSDIPRF